MSRRVMVNFEALAVENEAECQVALEALERIAEMLRYLDRVGEKIGEDKVIEYKKYLLQYREKIIKRTKKARAAFELNRDLKTKRFNADVRYNRTKEEKELAEIYNQLRDISNDLSRDVIGVLGVEIELMKIMLDKKIYGDGLLHIEEMLREKPELNTKAFVKKLEEAKNIKSVTIRELVYRELMKPINADLTFKKIKSKAERRANSLNGYIREEIKEYCRNKLRENNVSEFAIQDYFGTREVFSATYREIVKERTRNATLKAIIKAIRETGFVVDTKNNIKIDRKKDIVKMVAQKPSGQMAEFEVKLDGKFMYHFDGYEGGTCTNDIEPFLKILEEIYGIHIVSETVYHDEPLKKLKQRRFFEDSNKGRQTQD